MTTAKYTPGPWYRDMESGVRCDVRSESGRKVALCWGLSTSKAAQANSDSYRAECDANAHLIAAAPDLKAFAEKVRDFAREIDDDGLYQAADSVIAKAEGAS